MSSMFLELGNVEQSAAVQQENDSGEHVNYSELNFSNYSAVATEIIDHLNGCLDFLSKSDTIGEKSIPITAFTAGDPVYRELLAAGNKPLDALLYMAYHKHIDKKKMFEITVNPSVQVKTATSNYIKGSGYLKAWIMHVITKGNHPVNSEGRPVTPFLVTNNYCDDKMSEGAFAKKLSVLPGLEHFPADVIFEIELSKLDTKIHNRILMSTAGSRALKYASIACLYQRAGSVSNSTVALDICDEILELEGHWKFFHPLNEKHRIERFTRRLSQMIYYAIDMGDRKKFLQRIRDPKNPAFMNDPTWAVDENNNPTGVYEETTATEEREIVTSLISRFNDAGGKVEKIKRFEKFLRDTV